MPRVTRSALVPYTPAQMYELVDDVARYPEFLPWCRSSREWGRTEEEVEASIEMKRGPLHRSFTTRNRLQPYEMIEVRLVEGPFRKLDGYWQFKELGERATRVSLNLEYEFSSTLVQVAVGPVFAQIANTLVDAFVARARDLYGSE